MSCTPQASPEFPNRFPVFRLHADQQVNQVAGIPGFQSTVNRPNELHCYKQNTSTSSAG